jgi:putative membrane protein
MELSRKGWSWGTYYTWCAHPDYLRLTKRVPLENADVTARSNETSGLLETLPATISAFCVLIGGIVVLWAHELEPASSHMATHIGLMNVVAPLAAALLVLAPLTGPGRPGTAWAAALIQVALLWAWHAPVLQPLLLTSHSVAMTSHAILFVSAVWFWSSLLRLAPQARWHGIAIFLMTGKLACLLGVLLTFSPRVLHEGQDHAITLADQQLAGLLMIIACPLSYVVAGVILAAQLIGSLRNAWSAPNATTVR